MAAIQNALLASLPRSEYLKLLPALSPLALKFGDVLYEPGAAIREVYFPDSCLVSLLSVVDDHLALEVGMVGREGMVGSLLALGIAISPVRALVQGAGPAQCMQAGRFVKAISESNRLRQGVHAYVHSLMGQISRTAGCNQFHPIAARLARWLLMTRDRLASAEFRMTQAFLSDMLGVRRVGVTEAASALKRKGLIEYSRGSIRILDHRGLQAAACSCYAVEATSVRKRTFIAR